MFLIDKITESIKLFREKIYDTSDEIACAYKEIRKMKRLQDINEEDLPLTKYMALIEIATEVGIDDEVFKDLRKIDNKLKELLFKKDKKILQSIKESDEEYAKTKLPCKNILLRYCISDAENKIRDKIMDEYYLIRDICK